MMWSRADECMGRGGESCIYWDEIDVSKNVGGFAQEGGHRQHGTGPFN